MCDGTRGSMRRPDIMPGDVICINKYFGSDKWFKAVPHKYSDGKRCLDCSFYHLNVSGSALCIHSDVSCQSLDDQWVFKECTQESIVEDLM